MSAFSAAVLLLLLSGVCAGWRQWNEQDYRQDVPLSVSTTTTQPATRKLIHCGGTKVAVPCNQLAAAGVNRHCAMYESGHGSWYRRRLRCTAAEQRRGARCACRLPNRIDARGKCVTVDKCPACNATIETFSACGAHCQPTCRRPAGERWCPMCESGCVCDGNKGYIRDEGQDKCIKKEGCPLDAVRSCRGLTKCPGCTGIYTDNRGCTKCRRCPRRWHLPTCRARFCGYTPAAEITCSASGTEPVPCRTNRVDRPCPVSSYRRPTPCTPAEARLGVYCGCKRRHRLNKRGVCVPIEQCGGGRCGSTERYSRCRAHCEPSCGRPRGPRYCARRCEPGCVCDTARAYLRDKVSGKCVLKGRCPR